LNVLDSFLSSGLKSDFGSPHRSCGGHQSVDGEGGQADGLYPNCEAQGNVVVLEPDSQAQASGGCMNLDFSDPVMLTGLALLNLPDDEPVKITIMDGDGSEHVITSPDNAGRNSLWKVHMTHPEVKIKGAVLLTICFTDSPGALSYVDFFVDKSEDDNDIHDDQIDITHVDMDGHENDFPWCGKDISGFALVSPTKTTNATSLVWKPMYGYDSLFEGQIIWLTDLAADVAIVTKTAASVQLIKFFLPSGESMALAPPFLMKNLNWFHQLTEGPVELRADGFGSENGDTAFLGSCSMKLELNTSSTPQLSCGPGVTGFYLMDRRDRKIRVHDNIRNGQEFDNTLLPFGVDVAVNTAENVAAVKFEISGLGDMYETNAPYRMNAKFFYHRDTYRIKAHAYRDKDFSVLINTCEVEFHVV